MTTALTWEVVDKGMCGVWLRGLGRMVLVPWGGVAKRLMDEIDEMNKMDKGWERYIDSWESLQELQIYMLIYHLSLVIGALVHYG